MINYYLITKPGIILGNLIIFAAGFLLASRGHFNFWLFLSSFLGLALVIASACVFNNYLDRHMDGKMERTKKRPLVAGSISKRIALFFGTILGISGFFILYLFTNLLTVWVTAIGFCVYVFIYTLLKSRTIYATAIGSIAGGIPPLVGYCAASNQIDTGAILLYMLLIFWQMPHFYSIALCHFEDYSAALIPVLPVKKGKEQTKQQMLFYIVGFLFIIAGFTFFNYTGIYFLCVSLILSLTWLLLCLKGFYSKDDKLWARNMFRFSLLTIFVICLMIPFDLRL